MLSTNMSVISLLAGKVKWGLESLLTKVESTTHLLRFYLYWKYALALWSNYIVNLVFISDVSQTCDIINLRSYQENNGNESWFNQKHHSFSLNLMSKLYFYFYLSIFSLFNFDAHIKWNVWQVTTILFMLIWFVAMNCVTVRYCVISCHKALCVKFHQVLLRVFS